MSRQVTSGIAVLAGFAMVVCVTAGLWWLTFPCAVAIGAPGPRARIAIGRAGLAGLAGWGAPLVVIEFAYRIGPAANALAAIMGFKGAAAIPIVLTVLVGVLLGLSGAWLGSAARTVVLSRPWSRPVQKLSDQRLEVKDSVLTKS